MTDKVKVGELIIHREDNAVSAYYIFTTLKSKLWLGSISRRALECHPELGPLFEALMETVATTVLKGALPTMDVKVSFNRSRDE